MKLTAVVLLIGILARESFAASYSYTAMDVIVVEQADGSFKSSPFYVQFDSSVARKSPTKIVDITVNGKPVEIMMTMDKNGVAFFGHEFMFTDKQIQRLTSEQIKRLNLTSGLNEMEFHVRSSSCKCNVFRWKHTDKVVISDIDGTITKSDLLGVVLPMAGKDWTQSNVANLFAKIERKGYKFLYLSSRAIVQSDATRNYLQGIRQGYDKMPNGPVILNPMSFLMAVFRAKIERKPEKFKIACLSEILALFSENPFVSGYGNHINDLWAYSKVGVPNSRIFTINSSGKVKHGLDTRYQSTYKSLADVVDQFYPLVNDN